MRRSANTTKNTSRCPRKNAWSLCAGNFIPNCMALLQRLPLKIYCGVRKKQAHFAERIEKNGLPEPPKPKVKKTEAEKLAIKRARRRAKKKKLKAQQERLNDLPDWQDDRFFFIAGHTSAAAPYGVTWEEMGLNPWEKPRIITHSSVQNHRAVFIFKMERSQYFA